MSSRTRTWLVTAGSAAVLLVVVLLVSADTGTVWALLGVGVVAVAGYRLSGRVGAVDAVRSRLDPRQARVLGALLVAGTVLALAEDADDVVLLAAVAVTGYAGHRSGRVLRGALYGAAVGVAGAVGFLSLVVALLLVAGILGVSGSRELLLRSLVAAPVVGFFGLLAALYVVALGGTVGLVSGATGGAIARLTGRVE